ncbi:LPXTG-site transpeptidase family protein [hydrothermal vent metagenome]|uniref:LPXTG-site transpeptidase family protein n=1 Tax=hydrothermal vent metagenome TaxID=652676 RepID=A0A3B0WPN8_9ZZZZ
MKRFIILLLILNGSWFIGQGFYIQIKALLAQQLLERAWLNIQSGQAQSKPWPWADTWPIARLRVPRLDIDLIVLAGDSGRTLAFGPGHRFASASPGQPGNSLISAHRDTHFKFLQQLHKGDIISLETADRKKSLFRVESGWLTDKDSAHFPDDELNAYLHLITCYPFNSLTGGGDMRYIVSAVHLNS